MNEARAFHTHRERIEAFRKTDVYPVITTEFCGGRDPLVILEAVLKGGAGLVQMREKSMSDGDFLLLLRKARALTREFGALLIVDDRVDAAMAVDADGVHLGQEDFPIPEARRLAPELILGASTHNAEELQKAQEDGCSYLNIGPIYPTGTKKLACKFLGVETLRALAPSVTVPFTVMGGIKFEHIPTLRAAGAKHIAAVTAFTQAEDPTAEVRHWREAF
ncbi:MAG: thiamine phosphate synthase [Victivallales bacterium]|nr:thiamine phosphate synthase [Victivallales bacterium]